MKNILYFFFILLICTSLHAQNIVFLTDGSYLKGEILESSESDTMRIKIGGSHEVTIPTTLIKRTKTDKEHLTFFDSGRYLKQKGYYYSIYYHLLIGRESWEFEGTTLGTGLEMSMGYQYNRWLGIGGGLGLDKYDDMVLFPLHAEVKGNFSRKKNPGYYSLKAGYSIPSERLIRKEESNLRGGWFWMPTVGVQFASRSKVKFNMEVGYRFQRFDRHSQIWVWRGGNDTVVDNIELRRLAIRFGLMF